MRDADNIRAVSELGIDMIGFNFSPSSERYVSMIPSRAGIMPDEPADDLRTDDIGAQSLGQVGVFADEMVQDIVTRVFYFELDYVQLNGNESVTMIQNLKATLNPDVRADVKIIKTIPIAVAADLERCKGYEGVADLFLFDVKTPIEGSAGADFYDLLLRHYDGKTPFLLGGGIGPKDADRLNAFHHPMLAGIDLDSAFELSAGVKDVNLLRDFIQKLDVGRANSHDAP